MKCEPGDLAIIINAHNPTNIGKVVLVVERWNMRSTIGGIDFAPQTKSCEWLIETQGSWLITKNGQYASCGPIWDKDLMPIHKESPRQSIEKEAELMA